MDIVRRGFCSIATPIVLLGAALCATQSLAAQSGIEGLWKLDAFGSPAKLEFSQEAGSWTGRADFGAVGWEPITKISFNSSTGEVSFHRVRGNQDYVGRFTGERMEGKFSGSAPWHATRDEDDVAARKAAPTKKGTAIVPVPEISIDGEWKLNANGFPAKLQFSKKGGVWAGRADFGQAGWEAITKVSVDSRTRKISFYRARGKQQYSGAVTSSQQTPSGPVARAASGVFTGNAKWSMKR
jgi:hypothetical protein